MLQAILDALTWITDFASGVSGLIVDFVYQAFTWCAAKAFILWCESKIWMLGVAWDIASQVLRDLNVGSEVANAFGALPANMQSTASWLRVPEGINLVLNALTTKLVLRWMNA